MDGSCKGVRSRCMAFVRVVENGKVATLKNRVGGWCGGGRAGFKVAGKSLAVFSLYDVSFCSFLQSLEFQIFKLGKPSPIRVSSLTLGSDLGPPKNPIDVIHETGPWMT